MPTPKRLVFGESCNCLVVVQSSTLPSPNEEETFLRALANYLASTSPPRILVLTHGAAPQPEHRKRLDQIIQPYKKQVKFAIVTDSTFARGVLHAIRLIDPFYRGFSTKELEQAMNFLDVPSASIPTLSQKLASLGRELGESIP